MPMMSWLSDDSWTLLALLLLVLAGVWAIVILHRRT